MADQLIPFTGINLSDNRTPAIIGTSIAVMVLTTIVVGLRFIARYLSKARYWWDDWTILGAWVLALAMNGLAIGTTAYGCGKHLAALGNIFQIIPDINGFLKVAYAYEIVYVICINLTKVSILLFYSRIFIETRFKRATYVTYALIVANLISCGLVVIFQCTPVDTTWNILAPNRFCIDQATFLWGSAVPNVVLDAVVLCLPLPLIWTLEIKLKDKIALMAVFLLGSFVVVVAIIRAVVLSEANLNDITWKYTDAIIWTSVEPAVGVISACLPILRTIHIWFQRRKDSDNDAYYSSKARGGAETGLTSRSQHNNDHEGHNGRFSFASQTPLTELPARSSEIDLYAKQRGVVSTRPLDSDRPYTPQTQLPTPMSMSKIPKTSDSGHEMFPIERPETSTTHARVERERPDASRSYFLRASTSSLAESEADRPRTLTDTNEPHARSRAVEMGTSLKHDGDSSMASPLPIQQQSPLPPPPQNQTQQSSSQIQASRRSSTAHIASQSLSQSQSAQPSVSIPANGSRGNLAVKSPTHVALMSKYSV